MKWVWTSMIIPAVSTPSPPRWRLIALPWIRRPPSAGARGTTMYRTQREDRSDPHIVHSIPCEGRLAMIKRWPSRPPGGRAVSYTHLRAHETKANLVCRLLLEKKKNPKKHRLRHHTYPENRTRNELTLHEP